MIYKLRLKEYAGNITLRMEVYEDYTLKETYKIAWETITDIIERECRKGEYTLEKSGQDRLKTIIL